MGPKVQTSSLTPEAKKLRAENRDKVVKFFQAQPHPYGAMKRRCRKRGR